MHETQLADSQHELPEILKRRRKEIVSDEEEYKGDPRSETENEANSLSKKRRCEDPHIEN